VRLANLLFPVSTAPVTLSSSSSLLDDWKEASDLFVFFDPRLVIYQGYHEVSSLHLLFASH
jgi:hypothetical protein